MKKTKEFKNITIDQVSNTKANISLGKKSQSVEFYEKEGDFYIFDREGHCFRSVDQYNLVEKVEEEGNDGGQIRSPMPGVVVQVNVENGDQVKKVKSNFF